MTAGSIGGRHRIEPSPADARLTETAVVFDNGGDPWIVQRPRGASADRRCLCEPGQAPAEACPRHGIGGRR